MNMTTDDSLQWPFGSLAPSPQSPSSLTLPSNPAYADSVTFLAQLPSFCSQLPSLTKSQLHNTNPDSVMLTVIMPVKTMNQRLDTGLVQVTNIASCLSRFLSSGKGSRVDRSESVDDDLASYRLNRIDHNSYCSRVKLLE